MLERHLARTPAGLAVRIAQRILALTLGMLLNALNGRPARAPRRLRRPLNHIKPLALGDLQTIFFCEFDGPGERKVYVTAT